MNATRIRTALVLISILVALLATLYYASQQILATSYIALEEQSVRRNVGRALDALQNDLDELNSKAGDWANWDDAYAYVQNGNAEFIQVNATDVTFQQLKIDFIVFLQPSGKIIQAKAFDYDAKQPMPFPSSFSKLLSDKKSLQTILQNNPSSTGLTGIVLTQEYPVLIAARPILTSNGDGPVHGTLIFARHLDKLELDQIAARTHLTLASQRLDRTASGDDFRVAEENLSITNTIFVKPNDEQSIYGYGLVNDIFGNPAVTLRVDLARDIHQQGQATIRYFMLVMLVAGLGFWGISQFLLDRLVLSRRFQRESQEQYRTVIERAVEAILLVDAESMRLLEANPAFQKIFGYSVDEIPQLELADLLVDHDASVAPEWIGYDRFVGEKHYCRKDGTQLDAEASASVISHKGQHVISVVLRDVTARNRAQREILHRANEFAALYDTARDLAESRDLATLLQTIVDRATDLLSTPSGGIYLYDAATQEFVLTANKGPGKGPGIRLSRDEGIVSLVARTMQPVIVEDYQNSPYRAPQYDNIPITSALHVPMLYRGELIGALAVNEFEPATRKFTEVDARLLSLFAAQAAGAVHNTRLLDQEQTGRQELDGLYTLSRALADTTDFETMLNLVTFHAVNQIHTTFACIFVLEGDELYVHNAYPVRVLEHDLSVGKRVPVSTVPVYQRILESQAPVILHHMDASLSGRERAFFALDIAQSLCAVPLRVEDRVLGIVTLGEMRHPVREQFTPEKINLARSIADQAASALRRAQLFAELEKTYLQTVLALARAVDAKDTYTADHSDRLAEMALAVGRELGMKARDLEDLRFAAILHDIGKIGIPDWILKKPSRLTNEEWVKMRQHPEIGAQILAPVPRLAGAAKIVRHHHERFDGKGYPDKLAGEAIPLGARILTVVDSFSAIIDRRVYKPARSEAGAVEELRRNASTQFDPHVVQVFLELLAIGEICPEERGNLIPVPAHALAHPSL